MNALKITMTAMIALFFYGCPPIDDDGDGTDAGAMMSQEADASSSTPEGFDDECACDDDELSCPADCSEGLICAAFRCTLGCIEDSDCPDGYECLALSQNDLENNDELNLGTKYCIDQ